MSKFVKTDYVNKQEILKFPDHFVAMVVNVDDAGLVADADGKKIVAAGTIVGGGALGSLSVKVKAHVPASLSTALAGDNNDLVFTAKKDATIQVEYIDPAGNDKPLAVSVSANKITVSLATGGAGAITSTADDIKAAIAAHFEANQLVSAADKADNDGSGVVIAMEAAALAGGVNAEGILLEDVDCTYGPAAGSMLIHGFVAVDKVVAPSVQAQEELKGRIVFVK